MTHAAPSDFDDRFMTVALSMARRNVGRTGANPSVGCVITQGEGDATRIVGRGVTALDGRPHAETIAIDAAVEPVEGGTAYVTLEPCSHQGKTGPCADALIAAKIARVVVALEDPNPRVAGQGLARLKEAGVDVEIGLMARDAKRVVAGFLARIQRKRPLVTLKLATSLDGRIATHSGASQWITNPTARRRAHLLRASHDAIMVGSTTAIMDDPQLTCRIGGLEDHSPIRLVADGRLRLPLTAKLVRSATDLPTWLLTLDGADMVRTKAYADCGMDVVPVPHGENGLMDMDSALRILGERGVNTLLVEGGAHLASSLLQNDLVDRLVWFRAPSIIGGDGTGAVAPVGVDRLDMAPTFHLTDSRPLGNNVMETYEREL